MVWDHIRRFLAIWAIILAVLVIAALVVYGSDLVMLMSSSFGAMVELLVTGVFVVVLVVMLVRGMF